MIKVKPSYQTSDGRCFATYEEAQRAEIMATLFPLEEDQKNALTAFRVIDRILDHAAELRELLAPQIGRPVGSKNGTGKRRNRVAAAENAALQDIKQ